MSDEFLEIALTNNQPQAGGTLEGEVLLKPKGSQRCKGIRLELFWHISGPDKGNSRQVLSVKLKAPANLKAGKRYHLPFRLKLPSGPLSYPGELFRLTWDLQATVIGGGTSAAPWVVEPFTLLPANNQRSLGPEKYRPIGDAFLWGKYGPRVVSFAAGLLQLGFSLTLLWLGWEEFTETDLLTDYDQLLFMAFIVALFALGIHSLWKALRQSIVQSFLRVTVTPVKRAYLGNPLNCQLSLRPRLPLTLKFLNIQLQNEERCSYTTTGWGAEGFETTVHIKKNELFEYTHCPAHNHHIGLGRTETYQTALTFPPNAPATVLTKHHQLLRLLNITIKSRFLPTWTEEIVVDVYPN